MSGSTIWGGVRFEPEYVLSRSTVWGGVRFEPEYDLGGDALEKAAF